tara:strand:+ start:181 stop:912 length:732 start_codon:yes stop_codon:yes gene_type:complete
MQRKTTYLKLFVSHCEDGVAEEASKLFKKLIVRRPITVLLPGGNSPKIFFRKLINYNINWDKISLMATDERVVSLNSSHSNTGMIKEELLNPIANKNKPRLMELYPQKKEDIKNKLKLLERYLSKNIPEIAFLGIGKDGHTAGIFKKKITKKKCYIVKNSIDPFYRITISMNVLTRIPYLVFIVLGVNKKKTLEKIFSDKSSKKFFPTKFLLKNGTGEKIILCDRQAAPSSVDLGESIISINQ